MCVIVHILKQNKRTPSPHLHTHKRELFILVWSLILVAQVRYNFGRRRGLYANQILQQLQKRGLWGENSRWNTRQLSTHIVGRWYFHCILVLEIPASLTPPVDTVVLCYISTCSSSCDTTCSMWHSSWHYMHLVTQFYQSWHSRPHDVSTSSHHSCHYLWHYIHPDIVSRDAACYSWHSLYFISQFLVAHLFLRHFPYLLNLTTRPVRSYDTPYTPVLHHSSSTSWHLLPSHLAILYYFVALTVSRAIVV